MSNYSIMTNTDANTNTDVLVFTNGVFDLTEKKLRDKKNNDNMVATLGFEYKEFSDDDQVSKDLFKFLSQICVEECDRLDLLRFFRDVLLNKKTKTCEVWFSRGAGGVTTTTKLLTKLLGADNVANVHATFLTKVPDDDMDRIKEHAKLIVVRDSPPEKISPERFKEVVTNGPVGRCVIIESNSIPDFDTSEDNESELVDAMEGIDIRSFDSVFVNDPEKVPPHFPKTHVFKLNPSICDSFTDKENGLLAVLVYNLLKL